MLRPAWVFIYRQRRGDKLGNRCALANTRAMLSTVSIANVSVNLDKTDYLASRRLGPSGPAKFNLKDHLVSQTDDTYSVPSRNPVFHAAHQSQSQCHVKAVIWLLPYSP